MLVKSEDRCLLITDHKFLWFKWQTKSYQHDWGYFDFSHRKCTICGREELYFDTDEIMEDWRKKYQ